MFRISVIAYIKYVAVMKCPLYYINARNIVSPETKSEKFIYIYIYMTTLFEYIQAKFITTWQFNIKPYDSETET